MKGALEYALLILVIGSCVTGTLWFLALCLLHYARGLLV